MKRTGRSARGAGYLCLSFAAAALWSFTAPARAGEPPYRLTWLGGNFYPYAINEQGHVVGYDTRQRGYGPALLYDGTRVRELGEGEAQDISNNGRIVLGVPVTGIGTPGPVLLEPDGTRRPLGLQYGWGGDFRHQFSINDSGQVVGQEALRANTSDGRAFLWDNGTITYLDLGFPVAHSSAHGINNAGQVVGWYDATQSGGGYVWQNGRTTLLPTAAVDINERGQVLTLDGVWENGKMTIAPTLPLLPVSDENMSPTAFVREINDAGQVAGYSLELFLINPEDGHGNIERAFVWDPATGTLRDLNAIMGFEPDTFNQFPLTLASDINNAGQVIGFGTNGGWLLTPVPEPAGGVAAVLLTAWILGRRSAGGFRKTVPLSSARP